MRRRALALTVAALAAVLTFPVTAAAQQDGDGWIGIGYDAPESGDWSRVTIARIVPGSPAERAGLRAGDVITRVNGRVARRVDEFRVRPAPGDRVTFRVEREGRRRGRNVTVTAAERPARGITLGRSAFSGDTTVVIDGARIRETVYAALDSVRAHLDTLRLPVVTIDREGDESMLRIVGPDGERRVTVRMEGLEGRDRARSIERRRRRGVVSPEQFRRGVAGAEVRELNPGLAEYFGVRDGVVVLDVGEDTPASRSGLRAGDVIVRAGGGEVRSPEDLRRAIQGAEGRQLPLSLVRERQRASVTLRWEE